MNSRWYKRCGADFLHSTMDLTLEEKGAFSLCLDLIYDRLGPISDDARWLAGVCGVSTRKWTALRKRLIETGKIYVKDGKLSNSRADLEIVAMLERSRTNAENGAKGGRKSAETDQKIFGNINLGKAIAQPKDNTTEYENRTKLDMKKTNDVDARAIVDADFETIADAEALEPDGTPTFIRQCAEAAGLRIVTPKAIATAIDLARLWLGDGATEDEILTCIKQGVANAPEPIHSLRYFDASIRQTVARRRNGVAPTPRRSTGRRSAWTTPESDLTGNGLL